MRMLLTVTFPHEPFNTAVRKGNAGAMTMRILEETRPEAVYFTEENGHRQVVMVVEVDKASRVPSISEPWFLGFNADCRLRILMSPEDLKASGLDDIGKKWS